ncbi:MAG: EamA family transporter [Paracoccaceae bacterium]
MTALVFVSVLFAAGLHASWNAIIKLGNDKIVGMFVMSASQGLMGFVMIWFLPLPQPVVWPYLVVSTVFHSAYKAFLTLAYERGDLSRVYPIARGTAPMLVALGGMVLLRDTVSVREYAGIFLVGSGIMMMARGVFVHGESRHLLPFALASALMTAAYSLTDGAGARVAGGATVFVAWAFMFDAILFGAWAIARRGRAVALQAAHVWRLGAVAGGASLVAYWIVVAAMTQAPIALVSALRETSVLFAVAYGILFFGERGDRAKLMAAALIVSGLILTRI